MKKLKSNLETVFVSIYLIVFPPLAVILTRNISFGIKLSGRWSEPCTVDTAGFPFSILGYPCPINCNCLAGNNYTTYLLNFAFWLIIFVAIYLLVKALLKGKGK